MPTEAPSGMGSKGILKSYEYVFSQIKLNIDFFMEEIVVKGNMAFAVTSPKGTIKILANRMELPEANIELFVFEKVNGKLHVICPIRLSQNSKNSLEQCIKGIAFRVNTQTTFVFKSVSCY
jgi:hypothetical protein